MVYRGEYDPYGNLVYEWGSAGLNTRKFTGYERDATGLDYANARMYGPGRGRFMQPDPLGLGGANRANPQSLNRYSYVQNDPVNFSDPTGNLLAAPDGPGFDSPCQSGIGTLGGALTGVTMTLARESGTGWSFVLVWGGLGNCNVSGGIGNDLSNDECPVSDLTPITDPDAVRFENGNTIDTDHLIEAMRIALDCFRREVESLHGNFTLQSAYRPAAYQAHLREVWDKWHQIRAINSFACRARRQHIEREYRRHGLLDTQRPAVNSPHTRGEAIDVRISNLPPGEDVDSVAARCNLHRPLPLNDPVHFTLRP